MMTAEGGPQRGPGRPRRLYYVAMTRARQTLTLARFPGKHPIQDALVDSPHVLRRAEPAGLPEATSAMSRRYLRLSLRDVFLSFAGQRGPGHPVHRAIRELSPGDSLDVRINRSGRWELRNTGGMIVGRLAGGFSIPRGMRCSSATVLAIATWDRESSEPNFRGRLRSERWEVVVPELVLEPES